MDSVNNKGLIFPELKSKNFNIIKQLDISEPQHSSIMGFILNPNGKHGFGDIFLKEFFDIVIADDNLKYCDTEKWFVTVEKERFDISIRNRDSTKIIIIENKSNWADDQQNQLYRYWLKGIHPAQHRLEKYGKSGFFKIIYLSPDYKKQYTKQSISRPEKYDVNLPEEIPDADGLIKTVFFREEILKWLEKCMLKIGKKEETEDMYFYIKQYADYWRNSMANEIVNQVEELFVDKNQWIYFWKLAAERENIRNSWWKTFKKSMDKCFAVDNIVEGWDYISWGDWDFRWFLKGFDKKSLCLWYHNWHDKDYSLLLWADPDEYDTVKIDKLLEEKKYLPIVSAFERQDEIPSGSDVIIAEKGNFYFGDSMDGNFGVTRLAWYANYKTDEFLSQIITKIDRFRKDKKITDLLREINNILTKK